jgi:O-antigen ligase
VNQFLQITALTLYLAILVISPILFGAVHTYAYTLMISGVAAATILVVISRVHRAGDRWVIDLPAGWALFGWVAGAAVLVVQMIPLPPEVAEWLSPNAFRMHQTARDITGYQGWMTLSLYPFATRQALVRFATYGMLFFGLIQVLSTRKRIETSVVVLVVMMAALSVYGIYQTYAGDHMILWHRRPAVAHSVSGTYINRNHFAFLMTLGVMLSACLAAAKRIRLESTPRQSGLPRRWVDRVLSYFSGGHRMEKRILILFLGAVCGIGLILSASRGGIIAASVGLLVMLILFRARQGRSRRSGVIGSLVLVIIGFALHIGVEYVLDRFQYLDRDFEHRFRYVRHAVPLIRDYPLFGVGAGNFSSAYAPYQAAEDKGVWIDHAHNDWAEWTAEAGVLGLVVLASGVAGFLWDLGRRWRKRSSTWPLCMGALPMGALATAAVHSGSDFNLHIPANFLLLSAVAAIGYAAAGSHRRPSVFPSDRTLRLFLRGAGGVAAGVMILVAFLVLSTAFRHAAAEFQVPTMPNSTMITPPDIPVSRIRIAVDRDPGNAEYRHRLGSALIRESEEMAPSDPGRKELRLQGLSELEKAVWLHPVNKYFYLTLGWEYANLTHNYTALLEKYGVFSRSDRCMGQAARLAGPDAAVHESVGHYWMVRSSRPGLPVVVAETFRNQASYHYDVALRYLSGGARKKAEARMGR